MRRFALSRARPIDRRGYILEQCRGKSVLHLGCVDHPILQERLSSGDLLHAAIAGVASTLYGVDVDRDGLEQMRAAGFEHLYHGDAEQLGALQLGRTFDVVVAGEVLEHLANPGLFLREIPRYLASGGKLVVTVPSAQSMRLIVNALRGREVVHPDHNAYYSPVTLSHLLESHRFAVEELHPYWANARPQPFALRLYDHSVRLLRLVSPWLGEGLVATARVRSS